MSPYHRRSSLWSAPDKDPSEEERVQGQTRGRTLLRCADLGQEWPPPAGPEIHGAGCKAALRTSSDAGGP